MYGIAFSVEVYFLHYLALFTYNQHIKDCKESEIWCVSNQSTFYLNPPMRFPSQLMFPYSGFETVPADILPL